MRLVIADTGPVHYLILIGHVDVLPALFETVILTSTVQDELASRKAPAAVRQWIAEPPALAASCASCVSCSFVKCTSMPFKVRENLIRCNI